jgi:hypothetical protein
MATITLTDIQSYAQITGNIETRLIDFQVGAVRELLIEPTLGSALLTAIDNAVANTGTLPETEAFFNTQVKPYWCLATYVRFMGIHGVTVTQFGVQVASDPRGTFNQASDQQRANILRQAEADARVYKQKMLDYLESVSYTLDGVTFQEQDSAERRNNYINPIRKKQLRAFGGRYGNDIFKEIIE